MRCLIETQEGAERLLAYSTGRTAGGENAALEQHLQNCAACRDYVTRQRAVWASLDEWEAPRVSADFDRQLYARIEQEVSWVDRLLRPVRTLLVWRGLPVAAAACLVITIGIVLELPSGMRPQPPSAPVEITHPEQVVHALDDMEMLGNFDSSLRGAAPRS